MNRVVAPGSLSGSFRAPASKSHAHRLLICAALGTAPVTVLCDTFSDDILATIDCLTAMGAQITHEESRISVTPVFASRKLVELCKLPCRESGSTLRFLLPVLGALGLSGVFQMEGRLPERPLHPLDEVLMAHGMVLRRDGSALHVSGQLQPGRFSLPGDVSSQYLSGLLFALPLLDGDSTLEITGALQSASYFSMTQDAVSKSAIRFSKNRNCLSIPGNQRCALPDGCSAEGDWSGAAFFLCAGALSQPGILATGLNVQSDQADRAVLDLLRTFGAEVQIQADGILVRSAPLHGISIDAGPIPDLIPAIAAVAALARGKTEIRNAARLRLKESDRLHTVAETVNALGGQAQELPDGLIITGCPQLSGGSADSFGDHRIAMLAAVLAGGCNAPVTVLGAQCTSKSYPSFWQTLDTLKGDRT